MLNDIVALLALSRKADIETFLKQQCHLRKVAAPKNTHAENVEYFHRQFLQANTEGSPILKGSQFVELLIFYSLANFKLHSLDDPHDVGKAAEISQKLIDLALAKICEDFGPDYAKKNPHIVGNVLNVFRSAYLSVQDKT